MPLARVILFVKDIRRMTRFYTETLGLAVLPGATEGWVELDAGGAILALHAIPDEIAQTIEIADPPQPRAGTPIKLVFRAADPAAAGDAVDPEGNVYRLETE